MDVFLMALAGAVLPCVAWLAFFRSRDKHDPEPIGLLVKLFLIGALPVAFVAGIVNTLILVVLAGGELTERSALLLLPVLAIFVAPVTEETLKYAGATVGAGRHPAFDEPLDGIIYGTTVGLGFAAAETVDYLIGAYMGVGPLGTPIDFCEAGLECFLFTAFLRGAGSAVLHATASGIACYGMTRRKEGAPASSAWGWIFLAMLMHGLWNALNFLALAIPIVIYAQLVKKSLARSPHLAQALVPHRYYHPERYAPPGPGFHRNTTAGPGSPTSRPRGPAGLPPHPPTLPPRPPDQRE